MSILLPALAITTFFLLATSVYWIHKLGVARIKQILSDLEIGTINHSIFLDIDIKYSFVVCEIWCSAKEQKALATLKAKYAELKKIL